MDDVQTAVWEHLVGTHSDPEPTDIMTRAWRVFEDEDLAEEIAADVTDEITMANIDKIKDADEDGMFGKSAMAKKTVAAIIKLLEG
jgi:hypothetical protein